MYRGKPVTRMHVMAKPTGPVCNLNRQYRYYLSKLDLIPKQDHWQMSDETLESFIRSTSKGKL